MSSLFWYNCLTITGVAIAAFTIYKKRRLTELSTWIVFYLFATSITWLGEFTALGLFNSYAYKPGVFTDPWAENLVGHLTLNSTLWPGMAMLVTAYSLGYEWISLISGGFVLTEYLFVKLGIYEQHWWKYYMTASAVFIYLVITKNWFQVLNRERHGLPRFITLYFAVFVIIHFPIPLLLLLGKQYYSVRLVENMFRSSTIFILVYQLVETFMVMAFLSQNSWYWKLAPLVIAFAGQSILVKMHILIFQDEWNLLYTIFIYTISLAICSLMERYTLTLPSAKKIK